MDLKAAVDKYLEVVKEFGRPMPLSRFGVPRDELEAALAAWEEDYNLHRHFELIPPSPELRDDGGTHLIRGLPYSGIVFKESIRHVFES